MRGDQGVRRAQEGPGVAWSGAEPLVGIGWALAIPISGPWVGGRVVYRYSPPSHPPRLHHPGYYPPHRTLYTKVFSW